MIITKIIVVIYGGRFATENEVFKYYTNGRCVNNWTNTTDAYTTVGD